MSEWSMYYSNKLCIDATLNPSIAPTKTPTTAPTPLAIESFDQDIVWFDDGKVNINGRNGWSDGFNNVYTNKNNISINLFHGWYNYFDFELYYGVTNSLSFLQRIFKCEQNSEFYLKYTTYYTGNYSNIPSIRLLSPFSLLLTSNEYIIDDTNNENHLYTELIEATTVAGMISKDMGIIAQDFTIMEPVKADEDYHVTFGVLPNLNLPGQYLAIGNISAYCAGIDRAHTHSVKFIWFDRHCIIMLIYLDENIRIYTIGTRFRLE